MMRKVEYLRCKSCNRQVSIYFAHGAIQVYGCNLCYRKRTWFEKQWYKLCTWWRGRK